MGQRLRPSRTISDIYFRFCDRSERLFENLVGFRLKVYKKEKPSLAGRFQIKGISRRGRTEIWIGKW